MLLLLQLLGQVCSIKKERQFRSEVASLLFYSFLNRTPKLEYTKLNTIIPANKIRPIMNNTLFCNMSLNNQNTMLTDKARIVFP